jgi:hypothetical protein
MTTRGGGAGGDMPKALKKRKNMRKGSLINTNSYLRDSKRREALLAKTVVSSTAIEGVHLDWEELEKSLSISNKDIRFYVSSKSSESRR